MTVCSCPSPVVLIGTRDLRSEYFSPRTLQAVVNRYRPVCGVISLQRSTSIPKLSRLALRAHARAAAFLPRPSLDAGVDVSTMRPATNAARALVGLA